MTLSVAKNKADEIVGLLTPFCIPGHCMVVGSVRRCVPEPRDIEVVACPDLANQNHFDYTVNLLKSGRIGVVQKGMFPARYTQLMGTICNVDIFWCDKRTYGLNLFIRTGSAQFAKDALVHWKKITNGGYSEGAILHLADGTPVPTPTEQVVFEALKCKWVPPEKRNRPMREDS